MRILQSLKLWGMQLAWKLHCVSRIILFKWKLMRTLWVWMPIMQPIWVYNMSTRIQYHNSLHPLYGKLYLLLQSKCLLSMLLWVCSNLQQSTLYCLHFLC
jgi:hypothetical protein